ncbi:MAG: hypothetical protein M1829_003426 [Trizodia sp. TS-e1964]|nr:MAG: hypothetical protein M1829_003426 [Trizodia sp. TS-e1964]
MIESFNVPDDQVATYVGITSSIFSLGQFLTGVPWGQASDRYGRKPLLLVGMACTMITSVLFGLSRSLAMAITVRAISGLGNGNVGIIRTTVAEMVPERELQPRAFSIMPLIWTIGSIFGPAFGGFLANPASRHPSWFGGNKFFIEFPYALPNLAINIFFIIGLTTGILFLKETLESRKHRRDYGLILGQKLIAFFRSPWKESKVGQKNKDDLDEENRPLLRNTRTSSTLVGPDGGGGETSQNGKTVNGHPAPMTRPGYREVFTRQSSLNLVVYCLLALHSVAFDQLLTVFMHRQRQSIDSPNVHLPFKFSGGFGLKADTIGFWFALYGGFGMVIQFIIFPPLARRFGVLNCLKVCAVGFPIVYLLTPFTALLSANPNQQQLVMFVLMLFKCVFVIFAFPCSTILLTNSAVSLRILGTLNGFATSISAIGRASGPAIGGSAFTIGMRIGYVILPWWVLAGMAGIAAVPVWMLIEMDGFGAAAAEDSDAESEEGVGVGVEEPFLASLDGGTEEVNHHTHHHPGSRRTSIVVISTATSLEPTAEEYASEVDDFAVEDDEEDEDDDKDGQPTNLSRIVSGLSSAVQGKPLGQAN